MRTLNWAVSLGYINSLIVVILQCNAVCLELICITSRGFTFFLKTAKFWHNERKVHPPGESWCCTKPPNFTILPHQSFYCRRELVDVILPPEMTSKTIRVDLKTVLKLWIDSTGSKWWNQKRYTLYNHNGQTEIWRVLWDESFWFHINLEKTFLRHIL